MAAKQCVYLSNLPYEAHEAVVRDAFEDENISVASIQLLKKGSFNRQHNSGLACVTLTRASDVEQCCSIMDGKQIYGRPLIVRKDKFVQDQPSYDSRSAAAAVQQASLAGAAGTTAATRRSLPAGAGAAAVKAK